MSFGAELAAFQASATASVDKAVRGITLRLFSDVILSSPVDTGRFRGNWQTTVGSPAEGDTGVLDPSGATAAAQVLERMGGAGSRTYLTNNLPYAYTLEYGGYPVPVLHGSRVKGGGYVVKSIGGYSKQAPAGMVRVNFERIASILRESVA